MNKFEHFFRDFLQFLLKLFVQPNNVQRVLKRFKIEYCSLTTFLAKKYLLPKELSNHVYTKSYLPSSTLKERLNNFVVAENFKQVESHSAMLEIPFNRFQIPVHTFDAKLLEIFFLIKIHFTKRDSKKRRINLIIKAKCQFYSYHKILQNKGRKIIFKVDISISLSLNRRYLIKMIIT